MNFKNITDLLDKSKQIQNFLDENEHELDYNLIYENYGIDMKQLEKDFMTHTPKFELGYVKLHPDAFDPHYNYEGDSGFDLYSVEEITLPPFGRALIPTGLAFDIKDGYEIQVRTKSGLAINQGLMVLNSPGTVDNSYTGEIKVILFNVNNHEVLIRKGMKVAQAVVSSVVNGKWVHLDKRTKIEDKDRGDKAFGSTGI